MRGKEFGQNLITSNLADKELREFLRFNKIIDFCELMKMNTISKILEEIEGVPKEKAMREARRYLYKR
jgi:quinolinate synthase